MAPQEKMFLEQLEETITWEPNKNHKECYAQSFILCRSKQALYLQ
jgi:hypothetical protein